MPKKRTPAAVRGRRFPALEPFRASPDAPLLARVRVRVDGKRLSVYLGPYDDPSSRERYHRLHAAWAANGCQLPREAVDAEAVTRPMSAPAADAGPTVQDILVAYVADEAVPFLSATEAGLCRIAAQETIDAYGSMPARNFGADQLRVVRDVFVGKGLARTTINAYVARVRRAFDWAVSEGRAPADLPDLHRLKPLRAGRTTAPEPKRRTAVPWKAVEAVLEHLSTPVRGIVATAAWTGARVGEIVQLRSRDVDMTGKTWRFRPPQHKTAHRGHERVVEIGPRLQKMLQPFVRLNPDEYWFRPVDAANEHLAERTANRKTPRWPSHMERNAAKRKVDPLTKPGEMFGKDVVARALRRACKAAGGEPFTMHQIRHAAISRVLETEGREAALLIAGHNSEIVNRIYTRKGEDEMRAEIANRIG